MHFFGMILVFLSSGVLAAHSPTFISEEAIKTAQELREKALKDDTAYTFVEGLTTEVGARLAGSENDEKARRWTITHLKALGFDRVWEEPVTYPVWTRRAEHAVMLAPFSQPLAVTALGYSPATPPEGIQAQVSAFKNLEQLKAAQAEDIKGKLVYVDVRMKPRKDGGDYAIGSEVRFNGPSLASSKGAIAFLLRSAGTDSNRTPHTGITHFDQGVKPIPSAALASPDADLLERALAQGKPVTVKLNLDCGMSGEYQGANVIAEITGRSKPDEFFVMGGHLDSWDLGTGAVDDAAGVGIAVGAAHLIAKLPQRPSRSIRVIAFANEESGLWGAKAYAKAHQSEITKHILGTEADFGADRIWKLKASVKPEALGAMDQMMQVLAPLGVERHSGQASGSDISTLYGLGMAGVALLQDGTRYFDWHHTANDTLDKIDPEQLRQNVAVHAVVAYLAAEAQGDFGSGSSRLKKAAQHE